MLKTYKTSNKAKEHKNNQSRRHFAKDFQKYIFAVFNDTDDNFYNLSESMKARLYL